MGKKKRKETYVEIMNREFTEEIGVSMGFDENDYLFSTVGKDNRVNHVFCRIIRDEQKFIDVLIQFHSNSSRGAYVDEIVGACGFPIWIEAPADPKTVKVWGDNTAWGLPRFLSAYAFRERDIFLVLLLASEAVNSSLMQRVFDITNAFDAAKQKQLIRSSFYQRVLNSVSYFVNAAVPNNDSPLPSFEVFMASPGLKDLLNDRSKVL